MRISILSPKDPFVKTFSSFAWIEVDMLVPTVNDVLKPYVNYPKTIQQAILLVETHPSFSLLTKSGKKVLKCLLTRANQCNGELPIRARLDIVADTAEVSYKTVQRTMGLLKQIGWISPTSDGRTVWGGFTSFKYQFSAAFCDLVKLPTKETKTPDSSPETKMSDGAIYIDLSFKEDQQKISFENRNSKPITLPEELREIESFGVKETGICKLRGLAYQLGYKLEHIWAVAKLRCTELQLTGNRLYMYLQRMIQTPSDYESRANQAIRLLESKSEQATIKERQAKYRYKNFIGAGIKVRVFEDVAEVVMENGKVVLISGQALFEIYTDIENGKLREQEQYAAQVKKAKPIEEIQSFDKSKVLKTNDANEKAIEALPKTADENRSMLRKMLNIKNR